MSRYLRFFGADPRADVDDELEFHLRECADDLMTRGLNPEEARREAERQLGDLQGIKQELAAAGRAQQRRERIRDWGRELRYSFRRLRREPGFTVTAVATLTLGIGTAVAVFAVVDAVVFKPLPYPASDRLVTLSPQQNFNMALADALGAAPAFEASTGVSGWSLTLTGHGDPAVLDAQAVDAEFFRVVGVQPALGRAFRTEERDPGLSDVVILSHGVWQTRFGGDPTVIGRRIELDGYRHPTRRIIGVMPDEFVPPLAGPGSNMRVWIPLTRVPGRTVATDNTWYVTSVIARLAPDATVDMAATQVRAITTELEREFPSVIPETRHETAGAMGLLDSMVGDLRTSMWALLGGVGFVMLLACANLANLLLARGERRRRELAIRAALGAGRIRLIREQLTDSAILSVIGGAGGILFANIVLGAIDLERASSLPRVAGFTMDHRVAGFAIAASFAAALVFGLWPALRGSRGDVRDSLGAGTRGGGLTRSGARLGAVLVAGEIALATVLVSGAGLLLKSLQELRSVELGIDASDVVALEISPPRAQYQGEAARLLYDRIFERLRALPGVRAVGAINRLPLTRGNTDFPYLAEGHAPPDGPLPSANFRVVTPEYFDAVDQPLIEGRPLADADRRTERAIAGLINRTMANQLWPDESAVGKSIRLFGNQPFEVVGVVSDVRQFTLDRAPSPEMYHPHGARWSVANMVIMIEGSPEVLPTPAAIRQAVWDIDPDIPVEYVRHMADVVDRSIARRRFFASVLSFFGVLALALGAVGVFGVMAYSMGARRSEFGLRMALGATRRRVLRGAVARGAVAIGFGLVVGLVGSATSTRLLQSLLFGVSPGDPGTHAVAGVILATVAALATLIPALNATRVDAATVMRAN